jgi:hypothetical protein
MKIFLAYSDIKEDLDLYKELNKHLNSPIFKSFGSITDKDTALAQKIDLKDIQKLILNHDVIIPLLSVDFLNDPNSMLLLQESSEKCKRILPILARDCMYKEVPFLSPYLEHLIPENDSLLGQYDTTSDPSKIFTSIAIQIRDFVMSDFSEVELGSGLPFLILGIVSFLIGLAGSIYSFSMNGEISLMALILLLFMTITVVCYSRYNLITKKNNR